MRPKLNMHTSPKVTRLVIGITERKHAVGRRRRQIGYRWLQAQKSFSISVRVRQLVDESLFRNSAFLWANLMIGAVTGLGTIIIITRLYPVRAVGLSAAALSATSLVVAVSRLGLDYSLVRFLPTSRRRADLINSALTATVLVAVVASGVFLALPSALKLYALGGVAFAAVFLVSTGLASGESQLENIFIADRAVGMITRTKLLSSLIRLAAPLALLFLGIAGPYVAQGVVPVVAEFSILVVILARRGHRFRPKLSASATRDLRRFSAGTYIAGLTGALPAMILPLIILARFGPSENAYWYTAMVGATLLFSLPGAISRTLLAEAAHRPSERGALVRRSAILIAAVMLPVLSFAYLAAPLGLEVLGPRYAVASLATLRWLIIAAAMSSVSYVTGTILYVAKKTFSIAVINAIDAIIVLGLAATWAHNASQVAEAWVIGEVANVVLFPSLAVHALREVHGRWEALGADQPFQSQPALDSHTPSDGSPCAPTQGLSGLAADPVLSQEAATPMRTPVTHLPHEIVNLSLHHICVDARYLKSRGMGISWYLHQGIRELLDAGARLTLLTDDAAHCAPLLADYPGVNVVALPGRSGFFWEQRTVWRHLAGAAYDAYIAPANYGIPLAYRGPTRLILVVHDLIPLRLPHLYLLRQPLWAVKYLLSLAIAAVRADQIVAVSYATARDVVRTLRRSVIRVAYPPIPLRGQEVEASCRPAQGIDDCAESAALTGRYFVYNGGADLRKNVPTLLRAFAHARENMADIDLVILGTGYENVRKLIGDLGVAHHVHMLGYVDEATKATILRGAVAMVYPSRLEGFGLPIVEALAAGIPVVSGTGGSLIEIGGDAVSYVQPINEHSLASAMQAVATNDFVRLHAASAGEIQLRLLRERWEANSFAKAIAACLPLIREYDKARLGPQAITDDVVDPVMPSRVHERRRLTWAAALGLALLVGLGSAVYHLVAGSRPAASAAPSARAHPLTHSHTGHGRQPAPTPERNHPGRHPGAYARPGQRRRVQSLQRWLRRQQ
jgi:glycosyltransferase involved in cell wall biosynthesis/O-antigen/teichoic acid export membrane protein